MTANINIKKLKDSAVIPTYGSEWAAGADLYACLDTPATILPGNTVFIPTGIALEIPVGYAGLIYARSGPGDRIAQMVITPFLTANFIETDELNDTVRGEGGFGSSGKN